MSLQMTASAGLGSDPGYHSPVIQPHPPFVARVEETPFTAYVYHNKLD